MTASNEPFWHWGQWVLARARHVGINSQRELGKLIGLSRDAVYRWKFCDTCPTNARQNLNLLAEALGVSSAMLTDHYRTTAPIDAGSEPVPLEMRCGKIVMTSDRISIGRGQQEPSDAVLSLRVAPNASLGVIIDGLSEMIDWARHGRNQIASETVETSDRCKRYVKSDAQVLLEVQQSAHRAAADPCCAGKQGKQYDSFESFVFHLRLHTQPQPGGYYRCPWTGRTDSSPTWFRWEATCRQQLIELAKQVGVTFAEQVEEVAA